MVFIFLAFWGSLSTPPSHYEIARYRVSPEHRAELKDLLLERSRIIIAAGDPAPVIVELPAAANWTAAVITPIASFPDFFGDARLARWDAAAKRQGVDPSGLTSSLNRILMAKEEEYLEGPPLTDLETSATANTLVEIELFRAKAGFQDSLAPEREKINRYRGRVGRPQSHLFRKVAGAQWDFVCLTFYRDTAQLRAPIDLKSAEIDAAARASGFARPRDINPLLTRMIGELERTVGRVITGRLLGASP